MNDVRVSPNRAWVVSAAEGSGGSGETLLLDATTGAALWRRDGISWSSAFSPDTTLLATGATPVTIVVDKVRNGKDAYGYNAAEDKYEDLVSAGVIDPTKVVRTAPQNAASVAGLMLTTEALIAELPKEEKAAPGGHAHGSAQAAWTSDLVRDRDHLSR